MTRQQKGKSKKRLRSWHRRGAGPDRAWRNALPEELRSSVGLGAKGTSAPEGT